MLARAAVKGARAAPSRVAQRRGLGGGGGGGGGHGHHHDSGHGHHEGAKPVFLNLEPGRTREPWEWATLATFGVSGLLTFVFLHAAPDTNPATWARAEAVERNRRRAAGEDVEAGRSYVAEKARQGFARNAA